MSKNRQNEYVVGRILEGMRILRYPVGKVIIKESLYKDIKYLIHTGKLDFSDVKADITLDSVEATLINNAEWALQQLKRRKHVVQEGIDLSIFTYASPSRMQYRLLTESARIFPEITENAVTLNRMLNN